MKTNVGKISSLLLIAATLLLSGLVQTRADTPAIASFSNDGGRGTASDATLGWDFTLSSNLLLTQLGVWDNNNSASFGAPGDGLLSSHLVSIWTSAGAFVASATVPAGGGTLLNGFRYVTIPPTLLAAGSYVIGAYYAVGNQDPNASLMTSVTASAGVTYGQGRAGAGNAFPNSPFSGNGTFGPNFQFVAATPEAGSSGLLLAISGSLLWWKRRRDATS